MAQNLLNKKYYPAIWAGLIFASLVANVYGIYQSFAALEDVTRAGITLNILRTIFIDGAIPALWCFIFALITYSIGARRYAIAVPRNDFVYTVMIFTAIARLLCGIVDAFCILVPRMSVITSAMLDFLVVSVLYAVMFFFVFDKRYNMNPVERYNSFRVWASVYLILSGISVVVLNTIYLLVFEDAELLALINEALADVAGYVLVKDSLQTVASALALSIYAIFVLAAVIIGELMRKQARQFQDPNTRGEYFDAHPNHPYSMRDDIGQTYSDFDQHDNNSDRQDGGHNDNSDGNVFDEFDI